MRVRRADADIISSMSTRTIEAAEYRGEALAVRSVVGGALMGLANLVPGISGGTMLLAVGIYPQFIGGVAEVSTFRFRAKTVLMLACVAGAALAAIVGLASVVGMLVVDHRWVMYSLFIGLTLGGVPVLWRMIRPADPVIVFTSILGIAFMALLATYEPGSAAGTAAGGGAASGQYAMLVIAGIAGGGAMILPGISGAYLLLVLGQYLVILAAIDEARSGVSSGDWTSVGSAMHVFVPVAIGVAVGIVGLSNLMKMLLAKHRRPTLGVLLGLLLGAVIGLWPFERAVPPQDGDVLTRGAVVSVEGELVYAGTARQVKPAEWRVEGFTPQWWQIAASIGLILAGFSASTAIARLGASAESSARSD